MPSVFSPNGDDLHDTFKPKSYDIEVEEFQIFNRWGQLIFDDPNGREGWDGTYNGEIQAMGVYVYFIRYRFTGLEESKELKGNVTLIR